MPFQFCTGSGHVHGDVHDGAEAGEEDAGKEDLSDVDEGILGDEHQVFDIRYVIARQVDGMAEEDGRQAGCQDAAQGRSKGSQALFRPAVDEVHRRSQDDDRRDDGRCDGTHTAQDHGEKEEEEADTGEDQGHGGFDTFFTANDAEQDEEGRHVEINRQGPVDVVYRMDAHGADVGRNDDDCHPGLADGPKEKTVRAIRLNGLSGIGAIFHAQGDDLIAHTASVFLQIIADNIDDAGFFKDPAIAVDQLRLIDLVILPEEEAAGHHQHDDEDQAEPAGVDHAQSLTMLYESSMGVPVSASYVLMVKVSLVICTTEYVGRHNWLRAAT